MTKIEQIKAEHRQKLLSRPVPTPAPPPTRLSLPCVHEGRPVPPPQGQSVVRSYLECEKGRGVGGVVCRCVCNSKCPQYEPDSGTEEGGE